MKGGDVAEGCHAVCYDKQAGCGCREVMLLRAVIREDMSMAMVDELIKDITRAVSYLDSHFTINVNDVHKEEHKSLEVCAVHLFLCRIITASVHYELVAQNCGETLMDVQYNTLVHVCIYRGHYLNIYVFVAPNMHNFVRRCVLVPAGHS